MRLALGLGLPYGGEAGVGVPGGSPASKALIDETDGLALSFVDDYFLSSTGHYGSARVKHPAIPANNYNSHPFGLLTYAGASKKWVRGPSGLLIESDPALTLPYEWDENGDLLGIVRPEPQRTNLTTNSGARDGTVGIVGSGGVLPTGWSIPASLGLDVEVLATNVDPSIGGCRIRISGTTTSAGTFRLECSSRTRRESTDPGVITSIFCRAVDGSTTNMTGGVVNITQVNTSGGSPGSFDPFDGHTSLNAARRKATSSGTTGSTLEVRIEFRFAAASGADIDITIELGGSQIEEGEFVTSYIETAGSTVTRAADVIGPALDKFPWNEGNGVLTVNDEEVEPSDDGTILTLDAPNGHTHIQTVKWVPSS